MAGGFSFASPPAQGGVTTIAATEPAVPSVEIIDDGPAAGTKGGGRWRVLYFWEWIGVLLFFAGFMFVFFGGSICFVVR